MKRRVSLYIGGAQADLDDQSFVLLNYAMDDLTDPTVVQNSYTQQITLPGTPANHAIFGDFFRPDRIIASAGTDYDPRKRTDFAIYAETGEIIESGYVKLNSIVGTGPKAKYKVTLYGGLGGFFQALTYGSGSGKKQLADLDFLGGGSSELNFTINAASVASAWAINPDAGSVDSIWKVINFAPCFNGYPEGQFDADKAVVDPAALGLASSVVQDGLTYRTSSGYTLVTLPDKRTEWEMKELRSYLQRPVLSVRALLTACAKSANNGGYTVDWSAINTVAKWPYLRSWITLPLLPDIAAAAGAGTVAYSVAADWETIEYDPLATYTLTGTVPAGADVSASLQFKMQHLTSDANAPTPEVTCLLSTSGDTTTGKMTIYFLQAVAYDANNSEVGSSPTVVGYLPTAFSGTGAYSTTAEYLADVCTYVAYGSNSSYEAQPIASYNRTGGAGTPFQLDATFSLSLEATDVAEIEVYCQTYTVNIRKISDGAGGYYYQEVTSAAATGLLPTMYAVGPYSTTSSRIVDGSTEIKYTTSSIRSGQAITKAMLLSTGKTPADYLLALAKAFGLYFLYDAGSKTVTICTRDDVFTGDTVDLSDRVDFTTEPEIEPTTIEARWYNFTPEVAEGTFSDYYEQMYGKTYGSLPVSMGYEINAETKNLLDGNLYKTAATVQEKSRYFNTITDGGSFRPSVMLDTGNTYALWNASGNAIDFQIPTVSSNATITYWNNSYPGYDYAGALRLQFHDAEGKATDGADVLCWRNGTQTYPYFSITDDNAAMSRLNEGRACWDLTPGNAAGVTIPVFSRFTLSGTTITESLENGTLSEYGFTGVTTVQSSGFIFNRAWYAYLSDRYDKDTKVLRCRVNLSGLQVGQEMLRKFYYLRGCWWVLNKITNYSCTTYDTTECEFIQVKDKTAYTAGQY